jgi:hypothetical protein
MTPMGSSKDRRRSRPLADRILRRQDGREVIRLNLAIPAAVRKQLAIHAAETGHNESDLVAEALTRMIGKRMRRP